MVNGSRGFTDMLTEMAIMDMGDQVDTGGPVFADELNRPDPYAGLNRRQRRHAEAAERRAFKKRRGN